MSNDIHSVPPFKLEFTKEQKDYILTHTSCMLNSGDIVLGPYTDEFELSMSRLTGTEHAITVNTGTVALHIIFQGLGLAGKEILVPSNTNYATAAAAKFAGAIPQLYDSGLYPSIEDIVTRITPDTAAIVVVHIGGYITPDIVELQTLCRERGLLLIEDAAHAHGATMHNHPAGSFGDAAAFSFFLTKAITTGEGGLVTTNNQYLAEYTRQYRQQGRGKNGLVHEIWGDSSRLTEFGAIMGLSQLQSIEEDTNRRMSIINRYSTELSKTGLKFPKLATNSRVSGHKCVVILPNSVNRELLKTVCKEKGLNLAREVYEIPLHHQPLFSKFSIGKYPMTDDFADRHICLPLWRTMNDDDVAQTIKILQETLPQFI